MLRKGPLIDPIYSFVNSTVAHIEKCDLRLFLISHALKTPETVEWLEFVECSLSLKLI